jgi:hypothetical protein
MPLADLEVAEVVAFERLPQEGYEPELLAESPLQARVIMRSAMQLQCVRPTDCMLAAALSRSDVCRSSSATAPEASPPVCPATAARCFSSSFFRRDSSRAFSACRAARPVISPRVYDAKY